MKADKIKLERIAQMERAKAALEHLNKPKETERSERRKRTMERERKRQTERAKAALESGDQRELSIIVIQEADRARTFDDDDTPIISKKLLERVDKAITDNDLYNGMLRTHNVMKDYSKILTYAAEAYDAEIKNTITGLSLWEQYETEAEHLSGLLRMTPESSRKEVESYILSLKTEQYKFRIDGDTVIAVIRDEDGEDDLKASLSGILEGMSDNINKLLSQVKATIIPLEEFMSKYDALEVEPMEMGITRTRVKADFLTSITLKNSVWLKHSQEHYMTQEYKEEASEGYWTPEGCGKAILPKYEEAEPDKMVMDANSALLEYLAASHELESIYNK